MSFGDGRDDDGDVRHFGRLIWLANLNCEISMFKSTGNDSVVVDDADD
jgi:hypothetical protein